ncbi:MAG: insulinase family protein, partial [Candidatus Solibacter usitatus]|nr:insulinase family protein [Candidatus Solibacter usitatus]
HGAQTHRGNLVGKEDFAKQEKKPNFHGNLAGLGKLFDTTRYATPHSDIVALMVLEHQTHMLFKGTANRSAEQIARETDSLGGHLDAFTSKEMVCFNAKMLDEHLEKSFDILSDLVLNPLFREDDIEKEKGVILEELKMEVDNPEYVVHELFTNAFWGGHAVGKPILGSKKTIRSFTREMVLDHYKRIYAPANMVISAAGNVTHEAVVELASSRFGSLAGAPPLPKQAVPSPKASIVLKNKKSLEQVQICVGFPANPLADPQRYASYILSTLLGGSMSSRLFQNIREKRGLAYSVFTEQFLYRDCGCFSVYAGTSLASVPELLRLTLHEFNDLRQTPVAEDELRRSKDNLKGSFMLGLESTNSRMAHIARQHIVHGRQISMDELLTSVEKVTAGEIQSLAKDLFQPDRLAVTVLGRLNGFQLDRADLTC